MKPLVRARLLMLVASTIWGTSFVVGRVGVSFLDPVVFAFLENVIGMFVLAAGLKYQTRENSPRSGEHLLFVPKIVIVGVLNGLAYTCQYIALSLTTAINTSLLVNISLPFVPLIAWALLKERFAGRKAGGLVVGIAGAALVATRGEIEQLTGGQFIGNLFAIGAGALWAFWIIVAQSALGQVHRPLRLAVGNAFYTVATLGIAVLVIGRIDPAQLAMPEPWLAMVYLGVMSIGVGYVVYYEALSQLGGSSSAAYILLQSAVALALAVLLLSEPLTLPVAVGAIMILVAIVTAG